MAFYTELHPDWIPPRQYRNQGGGGGGGIASFNASMPSGGANGVGAGIGESPLLEMTWADEQRESPAIPLPRVWLQERSTFLDNDRQEF